jgi:hypothetical protein
MTTTPTDIERRATEARARRMAARQGYSMRKSRAALSINNHGEFMLIDNNTNTIVGGEHFDMSAVEVLEYLTE